MENLELQLLKRHLVGATIEDIRYVAEYDCPLAIVMSNGDVLHITANGDDMAHLRIALDNENNINLINL